MNPALYKSQVNAIVQHDSGRFIYTVIFALRFHIAIFNSIRTPCHLAKLQCVMNFQRSMTGND
jgi:hypothetical protein